MASDLWEAQQSQPQHQLGVALDNTATVVAPAVSGVSGRTRPLPAHWRSPARQPTANDAAGQLSVQPWPPMGPRGPTGLICDSSVPVRPAAACGHDPARAGSERSRSSARTAPWRTKYAPERREMRYAAIRQYEDSGRKKGERGEAEHTALVRRPLCIPLARMQRAERGVLAYFCMYKASERVGRLVKRVRVRVRVTAGRRIGCGICLLSLSLFALLSLAVSDTDSQGLQTTSSA